MYLPPAFREDRTQIMHDFIKQQSFATLITLEEGMTFTIEPMINLGKRHVKLLPDEWTVVTKDRSLSAQWEHTVLVAENGYEVLTQRPDEDF